MGNQIIFEVLPEVTVIRLACVEGEEEVVSQEDDTGEEVPDAVLVVVALHQLRHPN